VAGQIRSERETNKPTLPDRSVARTRKVYV
jgi:hypothetical protein